MWLKHTYHTAAAVACVEVDSSVVEASRALAEAAASQDPGVSVPGRVQPGVFVPVGVLGMDQGVSGLGRVLEPGVAVPERVLGNAAVASVVC